jgi:2-aminomuconate deaminase
MTNNHLEAPTPIGLYPHTKQVGSLLFLSGVGPRHPITNNIDELFEDQVWQVLKNVQIILEKAGSSLDQLVDVTVYLTDMEKDFKTYNRIYSEFFQNHPSPPTRTTLGITSLPTPISIEIKAVATV